MISLTISEIKDIAQIVAAVLVSAKTIYDFIKSKSSAETKAEEGNENTNTEFTLWVLIKWCRVYLVIIGFFLVFLTMSVISDSAITRLSVLSISSCVAAISFLFVAISYKYILWASFRSIRTHE